MISMKTEQVSFTSRINFVTAAQFENKFLRGKYIGFKNLARPLLKADEFYTTEIRTCTAGGLVNTKTGESVGFHYYDDMEHNTNIHIFQDKMFNSIKDPDRAFIIGGKDLKFSPYSLANFNEIKDAITKRVPFVSYFKEHIFPLSESSIHYDLYDDEWTINSIYKPLNKTVDFDVMSRAMMKIAFREAKIANGDTLLVNGFKTDSTHFIG